MPTIVTQVPGHQQVAHGDNIQTQIGNPTQYLVGHIGPYPNNNLIVGNTYKITDAAHPRGILVELVHPPGGGMQTATFQQQT